MNVHKDKLTETQQKNFPFVEGSYEEKKGEDQGQEFQFGEKDREMKKDDSDFFESGKDRSARHGQPGSRDNEIEMLGEEGTEREEDEDEDEDTDDQRMEANSNKDRKAGMNGMSSQKKGSDNQGMTKFGQGTQGEQSANKLSEQNKMADMPDQKRAGVKKEEEAI